MFNIHNIKSKLLFSLLLVMGTAFLFQSFYIVPKVRNSIIDDVQKTHKAIAFQLGNDLELSFQDAASELEAMASLKAFESFDKNKMDETIKTFNASNKFFNYYFVMNEQGTWLSYPTRNELVGKNIPKKNMGWVKQTFQRKQTVFLDVVKARVGTLVSGFSAPIKNKSGEIKALLRGVIVISDKNKLIRSIKNVNVGKNGYAYLVSSNGWLLAHADKKISFDKFSDYSFVDYEPVQRALNGETGMIQYEYEGEQWIAGFHPIGITNWALVIQQPLEDVLMGAKRDTRMFSFLFLVTFFIISLICIFIIHIALKPLAQFIDTIKSGEVKANYDYPKDEIGQLAHEYNQLYSKLFESRENHKQSEKKFRDLFNSASDAIFIHDLEMKILEVNQVACNRLRYTREELINMSVKEIDSPQQTQSINQRLEKLQETGHIIFETEHITKTGKPIPVEVNSRTIEYDDQPAILSIARDLIERKAAERALKESEERFRAIFEQAAVGFALSETKTGKFVRVNKRYANILGYSQEEMIGTTFMKITHPDDLQADLDYMEKLKKDEILEFTMEKRFIKKDGSIVWVNLTVSPMLDVVEEKNYHIAVVEDITERKQADEERTKLQLQLQHAQKMESIGTMAGGIAHDFNNLLMGIQGRTSLMLMDTDSYHLNFGHLKGIEDYVKSASDLTNQLLAFARGGKYEVKPIDLNELLNKSSEMFGRTKKEISIHRKNQETIWAVEVDQSQIEQVLLNLYVNAWQSMPSGGELYLETENVMLDKDYVKPFSIEPGQYVKISVTDTGVGMDKATRERIFDPFFTTKEMGRGTGLGLASAYGIIKNHNGFINVYSEKGKGTTFNIYLPVSEKEIISEKKLSEEILTGIETILLVDDEGMIIDVGKELLKKIGYKVLIAKSGKAAVELYEGNKDEIDIVILDMIMPDMGGGETYDKLKEINPDIKVLLSSGYSINGQATEILERGCDGFIQKPFSMMDLSKKIRGILDKD